MVAVLITTGKEPDALSRRIARALFLAVPGSSLEWRGKRTMQSLLSLAKKRRFSRLCAIYKEQGKPRSISFLSLGEEGWKWMSPRIIVKKAKAARLARLPQSQSLLAKGAKAKTLLYLLGAQNWEEPGSSITAGAKKLSLFLGKGKLLEMDVSYEK